MEHVLIIPAAGPGSRLGSPTPKLLHPVNGRPMVDHLIDLHRRVVERFVIVIHPTARPAVEQWRAARKESIELLEQAHPTGMLDAVLVPYDRVRALSPGHVWVTWCDQIAVLPATVETLAEQCRQTPAADLIFPTIHRPEPYIHFDRDEKGMIQRVLQRREVDALPEIGESDLGLFALSRRAYLERLPQYAGAVATGSITGERNFLPFIPWMARGGHVETFPGRDVMESVGINTPEELRAVGEHLRTRGSPRPVTS